jgi:hypothetical protein
MSVFLLPISLCKEINGMMQRFWWGHKENNSRIPWVSWEKMGKAKSERGLGFRDLVSFNKALLAKQLWRLLQNPHSMVAEIISAKYYSASSILEVEIGKRPSYAWRSLMNAKQVLKPGLIWRVGDGSEIKVWGDPWLPTPSTYTVQTPHRNGVTVAHVEELIDGTLRRWKGDVIDAIFLEDEAQIIKGLPLSPIPQKTE